MCAQKSQGRITWAVDAFMEREIEARATQPLRALAKQLELQIEPVYILTPDQVNVTPDFFPEWAKTYGPEAQRSLDSILGRIGIEHLLPAKVVVESTASLRKAADRLIEQAHESHSELILVTTHARRGVSRFLLGSFAETLILHSKLPVLVINPENKPQEKIEHILFPTDLSRQSRRGFEATVKLAQKLDSEIVLYYKVVQPIPVVFPQAPMMPVYASEAELNERTKLAGAWCEWARSQGITARVLVDEVPGDIPSAIIRTAGQEHCGLIAMISQLGPISSVLLGSIARQVIRRADCPVWVQHSAD